MQLWHLVCHQLLEQPLHSSTHIRKTQPLLKCSWDLLKHIKRSQEHFKKQSVQLDLHLIYTCTRYLLLFKLLKLCLYPFFVLFFAFSAFFTLGLFFRIGHEYESETKMWSSCFKHISSQARMVINKIKTIFECIPHLQCWHGKVYKYINHSI